jgi:hypothetical protein
LLEGNDRVVGPVGLGLTFTVDDCPNNDRGYNTNSNKDGCPGDGVSGVIRAPVGFDLSSG